MNKLSYAYLQAVVFDMWVCLATESSNLLLKKLYI
jgi:hypothetical protein